MSLFRKFSAFYFFFILLSLFLLQCKNESSPSPAGMQSAPGQPESDEAAFEKGVASGPVEQKLADSASTDIFSSSAARVGSIDSLKKFVRTADMRFRVKNAVEATLRIEDIAMHNGGFVVKSQLNTAVEYSRTTPVGRDSAMETTRYSTHNQLILRVPFTHLDTTLRLIGRLADFLDHRNVEAEDIGLKLLEEELARLRHKIYEQQVTASIQPGERSDRVGAAAARALESRAASDASRIETLKLEDAIRFSTVRIDIYQLPQIRQVMVANTEIRPMERPFATRLGEALHNGAYILEMIIIGLINLWGVILLIAAVYFLVRKLKGKFFSGNKRQPK